DANLDALCLWHAGIALRHPALNLDRATQCFDDAFEFREDAVAGALDDPSAMLVDLGVEELASVGFQPRERALLVGAHQSAVAGDVSRENGRERPYDSLGGHLGMPCLPSCRRDSIVASWLCPSGVGPQGDAARPSAVGYAGPAARSASTDA